MIGNDKFVQVFGSVPAGDDTLLVQVVANAVREGFHIVLCVPGGDTPICTLPVTQQKREHECGTAHVLSLESLLGPPLPFIGENGDLGYEPKDRAKVRAKVQAIINRVTKQHGGAKPNIGVIPGPSGYAVTVVVTQNAMSQLVRTNDGPVHVTIPLIGNPNAGWCWFQLPDGVTLPSDGYFDPLHEWWAVTWGFPMPVPPSRLGLEPYELIGQTSPAPAWLLERIAQS